MNTNTRKTLYTKKKENEVSDIDENIHFFFRACIRPSLSL